MRLNATFILSDKPPEELGQRDTDGWVAGRGRGSDSGGRAVRGSAARPAAEGPQRGSNAPAGRLTLRQPGPLWAPR
jgi:hypothetical protein